MYSKHGRVQGNIYGGVNKAEPVAVFSYPVSGSPSWRRTHPPPGATGNTRTTNAISICSVQNNSIL